MRDRLMTLLMVPVLILPLVVIAAGGDLEIVRREIVSLTRIPFAVTVYAQNGSPGTMPSGEVTPSGPIIPLRDYTNSAPTLTRWATICLSIFLGLIAVWYLSGPRPQAHET